MSDQPTLENAVDSWAADPENDDTVIELVSKHGVYDSQPLARHEVSQETGDDIWIYTGPGISDEALSVVTAFVHEYEPVMKQCYANAAELFRYDNRFQYVEGVTANDDTGSVHNHAWNMIDETPVDVTRESHERYGIQIPNDVLSEALSLIEAANRWDVLQNPVIPDNARPPYIANADTN